MPVDLGDPLPNLSVQTRNVTGVLENAGAVVLTLTLPDQTTTAPAVSNPSAGVYEATYVTVQAGRHLARWVATGLNASAYTDVYDVRPASPGLIISLADARKHLNQTSTAHDEELRGWIESITEVVEGDPDFGVGPVVQRTIVQRVHEVNTSVFLLSRPPVISLTSVTPVLNNGISYAAADLDVDTGSGIVRRKDRVAFTGGPWDVTYVAGRVVIPPNVSHAARIILQHVWETQRSTDFRRPPFAAVDQIEVETAAGRGFSIPRRAVELLRPSVHMFGFA